MAHRVHALSKFTITRKFIRQLNGDKDDLRALVHTAHRHTHDDEGLGRYLKSIGEAIDKDLPWAGILLRAGKELSDANKAKLLNNLIFNWAMTGQGSKRAMAKEGKHCPSFGVISPWMACNLSCTGCYSGMYEKQEELSEQDLEMILDQFRELGMYFVVISGGEPYVRKDMLLRLFKKYNDMFFLTFTNGTFLDKETCAELARLGNVTPAISVEGWEAETDGRRGTGIWLKVHAAMENLREAGVLFGISVTATRHNVDVITADAFMEHFMGQGALYAWYFSFMPVGKDPLLDLVPTPEQRVFLGQRTQALRAKYPMFVADFWNDGPAVGGCLAAGRQYFHILNDGRVEACVFAHFGVDNVRDKPIIDIVNSDFFKCIRKQFPYNDCANLHRPCMILDNPEVLRKAVAAYVPPESHAHSEDIVNDPRVMDFVDAYAARLAELQDPVWKAEIEDPSDFWYKGAKPYKDLFNENPD